ncbi:MAG TPA: hypothetical protein VGM39_12365 [Kofleriaceae bacterium]
MSTTRLNTIRFLALLVMIGGVALCAFVLYSDISKLFTEAQTLGRNFRLHQHEMNRAIYIMMGKIMLCQVMIGGGGFVRYKCRKALEATATPA